MSVFIIRDADGYWCGMRRKADKTPVHFWSTQRKDAARLHIFEAALHFARMLPQPVRIQEVRK